MSRYKNCILTQIGKRGSNPSSFVSTTLFFFIIFLLDFVSLTGRPKIFFFSFSNRTNKFIKIYFVYFFSFSSFTHCKTSEIFFQHIIFFPMCYSPSTQNHTTHTTYTTQFIHNNSCYAHHSHIKHNACSVLIMSRDCLGNHMPKLYTHRAPKVIVYLSSDTKL